METMDTFQTLLMVFNTDLHILFPIFHKQSIKSTYTPFSYSFLMVYANMMNLQLGNWF